MHVRSCNLGEYMLHLSTDGEMLAVVSQNARVRAGTTTGFNHLR